MQLVLQPCSSPNALKHFIDTIQNPVETSRILPFLDEKDRASFGQAFPNSVAIWGVTPGKPRSGDATQKGENEKKWDRLKPGDLALFYRKKNFFLRGTIAFKTRQPDLARELWHTLEGEPAWEFIYFISDLEPIQINILDYNHAAGYEPANIVQGFTVHPEGKSLAIAESLGLESSTGSLLASENDITAAIKAFSNLSNDLDVPSSVKRRVEQSLLRTILLGKKATECCALCGRDLPVDLLVIGHIRKRNSCTPEIKKDLANVMSVCLLGCDRLFENGYVTVDEAGVIQQGPSWKLVPSIQAVIKPLIGTKCSAWSQAAEKYFGWHRKHHNKFA